MAAPPSDGLFDAYAAFYDVLYAERDDQAEVRYVAALIRAHLPTAQRVLEWGSGTGRHGVLLAREGFDVRGSDRSAAMAAIATERGRGVALTTGRGSFRCDVGDLRVTRWEGPFDAVIALFHVVSYQTTDADLEQTFNNAARHLDAGGMFVFDVWHGPAVIAQGATTRVKRAESERFRIVRVAEPEHIEAEHLVRVRYTLFIEDARDGRIRREEETHALRYLFPAEVARLAAAAGFEITRAEEWMTGRAPGPGTWGVCYAARKIGGAGDRAQP